MSDLHLAFQALAVSVARARTAGAAPFDVTPLAEQAPDALTDSLSQREKARLLACARLCFQLDEQTLPAYQTVEALVEADGAAREMAARLARRVERMTVREGRLRPLQVCTAPPPWLEAQLDEFAERYVRVHTPLPQVHLTGLGSIHYEHPEDRIALDAFRALPGVDALVSYFIDNFVKQHEMELLLNAVEATPGSTPELDRALEHACAVLQVEKPRLYLVPGPVKNAYTTGVERPIIVLYERLVECLTPEELVFVIGHELGHYKSGHVLYYNMASMASRLASSVVGKLFGIGETVLEMTLLPALRYWSRRSEYTADRAGLLACQDPTVAVTALAKFAGLTARYGQDFEAEDLIAQARRLDDLYDEAFLQRAYHAFAQLGDTHPRNVWRVKTLMDWVDTGEYEDLVHATSGERDYFRERVDDDPMIAMFLDEAVLALAVWSDPEGRSASTEALQTARRMLRLGREPRSGTLSTVFSVHMDLKRTGTDLTVTTRLFALQDGQPVSVSLPARTLQSWSRLPGAVRTELLRTGDRGATYEVYRRGGAE